MTTMTLRPKGYNEEWNVDAMGQEMCYLQDHWVKIEKKSLKRKTMQPYYLRTGKLQYITVLVYFKINVLPGHTPFQDNSNRLQQPA